MRSTLPLLALLGVHVAQVAAEPLLYGLHVIRQEQEDAAAAEAAAPAAPGDNLPPVNDTPPAVNETDKNAIPKNETAVNATEPSTAGIGHQKLTSLAGGGLGMTIDVGTPPQAILVALSFDEIPSDLRLTDITGASLRGVDLGNPSDEVLDASKQAAGGEAGVAPPVDEEPGAPDAGEAEGTELGTPPPDAGEAEEAESGTVPPVASFDNPSDEVLDASVGAQDAAPQAAPEAGNVPPVAGVENPSNEVLVAAEGAPGLEERGGNSSDEVLEASEEAQAEAFGAGRLPFVGIFDNPSSEVLDAAKAQGLRARDCSYQAKEPRQEPADGEAASGGAPDGPAVQPVPSPRMFNPMQSSTFQKANKTGDEPGATTVAADTVTVGSVTITDQPFLLTADSLSGTPGRLSLGLRGDNASLSGLALHRALAKHWPAPELGLFVAPILEAAPPVENAGELTLGGLNPALYTGEVKYMPVRKDHWALEFTYLGLGFKPIMVNGTYTNDNETYNAAQGVQRRQVAAGPSAAFSLEESSLLNPEIGDALIAGIPGATRIQTNSSTTYTVPCETNATLIFMLAGYNFSLPPTHWISRAPGGECVGLFKPLDAAARARFGYGDDTLIVFGLNALRTVYTSFRVGNGTGPPQIGFANLSDVAKAVVPGDPTSTIPGETEGPFVTGKGKGAAAAPGTGASLAFRAVGNIVAILFTAVFVLVIM